MKTGIQHSGQPDQNIQKSSKFNQPISSNLQWKLVIYSEHMGENELFGSW